MIPRIPSNPTPIVRLALLLSLAAILPACKSTSSTNLAPPVKAIEVEPTVRVRIAQGAASARLTADTPLIVAPSGNASAARTAPHVLDVTLAGRAFVLNRTTQINGPALVIRAADGSGVNVAGVHYPGAVELVPALLAGVNRFDVINHVTLEDYLPGVLDRELFASWSPGAFRAQAIAARSYALYMLAKSRDRAHDLESTVASQAYGGSSAHDKAREAVRQTHGLVLTWSGRVLPAYYSSCSGGTGQDAALALVDAPDLPPLRGRYQGGWGAQSRYYRWGPISRGADELSRRVAAWGRANRHAVAGLRAIREIEVSSRNAAGRPTGFRITDSAGKHFTLGPEQFRFACNAEAPGHGAVSDTQMLRSSHVSVRVVGAVVQFYDGRGFGHGVGLDQWGAQQMAVAGYAENSILAFYYPGAKIEKAY